MRKNILMKRDYTSKEIKKLFISEIQRHNSTLLINKNNLIFNANYLFNICKNTTIAPVIKSDAYGLGAIEITKIYINLGLKNFFVGNTSEAIKIRKKFKNINIFILNCGMIFDFNLLKKYKLTPVINNINQLTNWPLSSKNKIPCMIHIDTGMNRLGLNRKDFMSSENKTKLKKMNIKYLISHLACADDEKNSFNTIQLLKLKKMQIYLKHIKGINIKTSISNSSGIWLGKKYFLDLVRPGAAFLGINPSINNPNPLKNVICLYTYILQTRIAYKNTTVGYGASYKLHKKSKLATISIGYSNGFSRLLSNVGSVFINDKEAKIVGKISMDLSVVDITDFKESNIKVGDPVEIFGENRSIDDFATLNNTIAYEIICQVGKYSKKIIY